MTEVFFYHGAADRIAAACALLSGAHAQQKPMLVYAPDPATAEHLDRALWAQQPLSFVPHCRADAPQAAETPILITGQLDTPPQQDRLMNLDHGIPPGFERFTALIEVVAQDEQARSAGRERVHHYRAAGCNVRFVDLSNR